MNFNGYYIGVYDPYDVINYGPNGEKYDYHKDTTLVKMLFFRDGIFAKGTTDTHQDSLDLKYLEQTGISIMNDFNFFPYQGLYKIEGDTLKIQSVNHQNWPNPYWHFSEVWFVILDNRTLKSVYAKDNMKDSTSNVDTSSKIALDFIETNLKLPSNTWLKNEEWFWCNEEQYEKWKANQTK